MSTVVATWRPADAVWLQRALRLTNEAFAETLGSAPRTVAKWRANPGMSITNEMQAALDTMLSRAPDDAHRRFEALRGSDGSGAEAHEVRRVRSSLAHSTHLHSALELLDDLRGSTRGESFDAVVARAVEMDEAGCGVQPDRRLVADRLVDYYSRGSAIPRSISVTTGLDEFTTTLVTPPGATLGDLRVGEPTFGLTRFEAPPVVRPTPALVAAAETRLAACLRGGTRFSDQPTYRLLRYGEEGDGIRGRLGLTSFARYALTWDLLESELLGAIATGTMDMPLRDQLLPTVAAALEPGARECVGGALALAAFARPAAAGRPADYVVLIQQRSARVLNGTGRLSVIPKCFHQPTNEAAADVDIRVTLLRELEEELFGRLEADTSLGVTSVADLLHPSRLTEPMRWLMDSSALDLRLTGFAYNLVAGSFEFPALLAVHDETFWQLFGGAVEANWESSGLLRYSSCDAEGLEALLHDPRWSDEGLVACALGLKQLAQMDTDRVRLPAFEIGVP